MRFTANDDTCRSDAPHPVHTCEIFLKEKPTLYFPKSLLDWSVVFGGGEVGRKTLRLQDSGPGNSSGETKSDIENGSDTNAFFLHF